MTLLEAIKNRHSIRHYLSGALTDDAVKALTDKINECNELGNLHIQLVLNETKCFTGLLSYGSFSGVENYFVMIGEKADDLDERVGYYGEQIVLLAQQLGLGTCWVGLTYRKVDGVFELRLGEKLVCMIAVGYPQDNGRVLKRKTAKDVSNASDITPQWFNLGVEAALLAPTAMNQQKFFFEYIPATEGGKPKVKAIRKFSLVGYTKLDLGIAKLHFEIAAGKENFDWLKS